MKIKKIMLIVVLIIPILTCGCSNSQPTTFEEFKERYNENVQRENLSPKYLISRENTSVTEFDDGEGTKYILYLCDFDSSRAKLTLSSSYVSKEIVYIDVRILNQEYGIHPKKDLSLIYSLAAMCFDDKWKNQIYSSKTVEKILDGEEFVNGNFKFTKIKPIFEGDQILGITRITKK